MGSALTPDRARIELNCGTPSWCLQKNWRTANGENPHTWCQKYSVGRGKFSLLAGIREVGFSRTALAHGNMWFGKGKEKGQAWGTFSSWCHAVTPGVEQQLCYTVTKVKSHQRNLGIKSQFISGSQGVGLLGALGNAKPKSEICHLVVICNS